MIQFKVIQYFNKSTDINIIMKEISFLKERILKGFVEEMGAWRWEKREFEKESQKLNKTVFNESRKKV